MYVPAGQPIGSSHLPIPVCACLPGLPHFERQPSTWTPTESTVQQICRHSAARVARGLRVGPIYEIGLAVTTFSDEINCIAHIPY